MVVRRKTLKQLRAQVARERSIDEDKKARADLERTLIQLKRGRSTDLGGRIRRGFKILVKKSSKAAAKSGTIIAKQARRIREEQIRQDKALSQRIVGRKRVVKKRPNRLRTVPREGFDVMTTLDF